MASAETRAVRIENSDGQSVSGTLRVTHFTKKERILRALKLLGILWGVALATVFIPLAHFVLVPSFLIAGPIMAFRRYRVTAVVENVTGECPTCKQSVEIALEPSAALPVWTYCSASNDPIQLVEESGGANGGRQ